MHRFHFHRQPSIKGRHRDPLPACVLHDISVEVERLARRYKVSRSWVIATILADSFGIAEQTPYYRGLGMSVTVQLWIGSATYGQGARVEQTKDDDLVVRGADGREISWHAASTWSRADTRDDQGRVQSTLTARTPTRKFNPDEIADVR
jgi:hypothetical protein